MVSFRVARATFAPRTMDGALRHDEAALVLMR
jgi:hypothetical protein